MKTIIGDIFEEFDSPSPEGKTKFLIHQANCFYKMASGIAKMIKDRYPQAYSSDLRTNMGIGKLGTYSIASIVDSEKYIVNLYGQASFSRRSMGDRDTSYDAFYDALKKIFRDISFEAKNFSEVLIPYGIASNLAGARWPIIEKMIEVLSELYSNDMGVTIVRLESQKELK